jgi:hypothetical protein
MSAAPDRRGDAGATGIGHARDDRPGRVVLVTFDNDTRRLVARMGTTHVHHAGAVRHNIVPRFGRISHNVVRRLQRRTTRR